MAKKKEPMTLDEIAAERDQSEKELRYWEHREKILAHQEKELNRKARNHRIFTRGAMVETFLRQPEKVSDDQVMELLKIAFRQSEVSQTLKKMLENDTS